LDPQGVRRRTGKGYGQAITVTDRSQRATFEEARRLWKERSWRRALLTIVSAWNRNQVRRIVTAILLIWITGATGLHLAEGGSNPAFDTWWESLWNVWLILFSGINSAPTTVVGRILTIVVIVSGVALVGLFTASVASFLIERSLRSREVSSLEMSEHLVLCNWAPRGLEWVREVHSSIVGDKRPVVIIHDNPDEVELPDKLDDPAFNDVYIVKGDPANEVILRRAKVAQAHSVVVLADDRQGPHADGKSIVCCIAVKNVCRGDQQPNVLVECLDPKYRAHMRKAGADEVISAAEFGLRLLARAALFHGMTRVYQELLTVGRDANELYLIPIPAGLVGKPFVEVAGLFLNDRANRNACLLIGIYRGEKMMLNPVAGEAGPLREGDELILLCPVLPDLTHLSAPSPNIVSGPKEIK
jgi:voltage-gated potassium channel